MGVATTLPLTYELVIYSGTTFRREFRWLPDGAAALDFSDWTATLRIGPQQGTALIELSTSNGGVLLTQSGQIILSVSPAQTASLRPGVLAYNLDLTDPNGFVLRFLRGRVSIIADVGPVS